MLPMGRTRRYKGAMPAPGVNTGPVGRPSGMTRPPMPGGMTRPPEPGGVYPFAPPADPFARPALSAGRMPFDRQPTPMGDPATIEPVKGAMGSLTPPDMAPSEVYPFDPLSALKRRGGPGGPMMPPTLA